MKMTLAELLVIIVFVVTMAVGFITWDIFWRG